MKVHNAYFNGTMMFTNSRPLFWCLVLAVILYSAHHLRPSFWYELSTTKDFSSAPPHIQLAIAKCQALRREPGPPPEFWKRSTSDRFEPGTKPVLVTNAKIWTGKKNGTEVIYGNILMDKGIIKGVGKLGTLDLSSFGDDLVVVDANEAWVTPGLVDAHTHHGVYSSPTLRGVLDDNSEKALIQPWLRSLDGLNTHDDTYYLSLSGGVTSGLVLPGSADAIGGQAFVIKLRETQEKSSSSMVVEPPHNINDSFPDPGLPFRWRHLKHACGENPSHTFHGTRMDTVWGFREAYEKARSIKVKQDDFCSNVLNGMWELDDPHFPEELQWEALVDVLRGRVKVNAHCYEAVDLDAFVRLSNEFEFPIAAFHHASEAYLVPDVLKRAYGKPPAVALFAAFSRYKREAYRSSVFAPRILAQNGITVLMKSDHPAAIDSRHLIFEAQQAFFYGLPHDSAIASVTSNAAEVIGMGHRLGYIREGWDADVVLWDSHPLALGATPTQVFVDGIPQLQFRDEAKKPPNYQVLPKVPSFDKEANEALKYEGLPPLEPKRRLYDITVFVNVTSIYRPVDGAVQLAYAAQESAFGTVVVENGTITCLGSEKSCYTASFLSNPGVSVVDLEGGSISPGFVSYGAPLGLENINQEPSTNDGIVFDPLLKQIPKIVGGDYAIVRAADGLQFGTRDALLAYRSGVTSAVTAPMHKAFYAGLGVSFSLGALDRLENNALIQEVTGLHFSIRHFSKPSVSSQIATLRRLLLGPSTGSVGAWVAKVKEGSIPLIIEAQNADIIATLLILKAEVEMQTGNKLRMTITGGWEAHLLARELSAADVGVILTPSKAFPAVWENRRILPGPPLSKETTVMTLLDHGVTVGLGCNQVWAAPNLPFDLAWEAIQSNGRVTKEEAFAIGSVNVEKLLGVKRDPVRMDMVATRGGDLLEFGAEVVAVISPGEGIVNLVRE